MLASAYASCGVIPRTAVSRSIRARTAARQAAIRSGPTPVVTHDPLGVVRSPGALGGAGVADREERAPDADRQVQPGAGGQVLGVEVAAPRARRDDRVGSGFGWRDADRAGDRGERHLNAVGEGRRGPAGREVPDAHPRLRELVGQQAEPGVGAIEGEVLDVGRGRATVELAARSLSDLERDDGAGRSASTTGSTTCRMPPPTTSSLLPSRACRVVVGAVPAAYRVPSAPTTGPSSGSGIGIDVARRPRTAACEPGARPRSSMRSPPGSCRAPWRTQATTATGLG